MRQDASLRSGPDAGYPEVAWVREGESLWIHGCIDDWSWCDVSWYDRRGGEYRGWMSAGLIDYDYFGDRVDVYDYGPGLGLPVLGFSLELYWGRYYRARPWYGERAYWRAYRPAALPPRPPFRPLPAAPRPGAHDRDGRPAPGRTTWPAPGRAWPSRPSSGNASGRPSFPVAGSSRERPDAANDGTRPGRAGVDAVPVPGNPGGAGAARALPAGVRPSPGGAMHREGGPARQAGARPAEALPRAVVAEPPARAAMPPPQDRRPREAAVPLRAPPPPSSRSGDEGDDKPPARTSAPRGKAEAKRGREDRHD